jgi:hypothetical protein
VIIAASCVIAAAVVILVWKLLYRIFDHGDYGIEIRTDDVDRELGEGRCGV